MNSSEHDDVRYRLVDNGEVIDDGSINLEQKV